jgi:hypothetical protein
VIDLPNSNGIWYDVGNVDGRFLNNWVEGVGHNEKPLRTDQLWPSDNGFFFEISKGCICVGNVFVDCDHGLMVLNSSNVQMYQNTFVNSTACIGRNARTAAGDHFGWHPSTGPDVDKREGHVFVNNLLTSNEGFHRPLLFVWQPASLCERLTKPQLKQLDYNAYVRSSDKTSDTLILWSPASNENCQMAFASLEALRTVHPEFLSNSRYYANYDGPLFRGMELGNYELLQAFPGSKSGMQLPTEVSVLLGKPKKEGYYVGASPPVR